MNKETSKAIALLRFPLIVGVVLIHSSTTTVALSEGEILGGSSGYLNLFIQYLFSEVLARVSVPLFFLFSGYLLFGNKDLTVELVKHKWIKRFQTLFIPYIIWNIIILIIQIFGQTTPGLNNFFSGNKWNVQTMGFIDYADAVLGFSNGPINYPLWFIRDLMLLVLLSPLLHLLLTKSKGLLLALIAPFWLGLLTIDIFISNEALLFFSAGLFLAQIKPINYGSSKLPAILLSIYLPCALTHASLMATGTHLILLHKASILLGCTTIIALFANINERGKTASILQKLSPTSFFIYAAHGSLLQIFKKASYVLLKPQNDLMFIAIYFFAPVATIATLIIIYHKLLPYIPRTLRDAALGKR